MTLTIAEILTKYPTGKIKREKTKQPFGLLDTTKALLK
jgi:hypothetical protein